MKKGIVVVMFIMTGCAGSFQMFPGVGKGEIEQTNQNVFAVAQAVQKLGQEVENLKLAKNASQGLSALAAMEKKGEVKK